MAIASAGVVGCLWKLEIGHNLRPSSVYLRSSVPFHPRQDVSVGYRWCQVFSPFHSIHIKKSTKKAEMEKGGGGSRDLISFSFSFSSHLISFPILSFSFLFSRIPNQRAPMSPPGALFSLLYLRRFTLTLFIFHTIGSAPFTPFSYNMFHPIPRLEKGRVFVYESCLWPVMIALRLN